MPRPRSTLGKVREGGASGNKGRPVGDRRRYLLHKGGGTAGTSRKVEIRGDWCLGRLSPRPGRCCGGSQGWRCS